MKLPNNDNSSVAPPIGARRCPVCGLPIFLAKIEPSDKLGHDQHTFWCIVQRREILFFNGRHSSLA